MNVVAGSRALALGAGYMLAMMGGSVRANAQEESIRIRGMKLDSKAMQDSLSVPYWRALAAVSCPAVAWTPRFDSDSSYQLSVAPLRARVRRDAGSLLDEEGSVISRQIVFEGPRYRIERITLASRLPSSIVTGFLAQPRGLSATSAPGTSPPVVLIHGSGMVPAEAFGWIFSDQYAGARRFANTAFEKSALELVEAGYTVFVPWLGDDYRNTNWPLVQWQLLEENASMLGAKSKGMGAYHILRNEVVSVIDFLSALPSVDSGKLSLIGWAEGAQVASIVAALDGRVSAVVKLSAPLDRRALRRTIDGVFGEAAFTHGDCAVGDYETAALIAPRPLLHAYSTADQSVSRFLGFVSPEIMKKIRALYVGLHQPGSFAIQPDTAWSADDAHRVRTWLDTALAFVPRTTGRTLVTPRAPSSERYRTPLMTTMEEGRRAYIASLGGCAAPRVVPNYTSLAAFEASVAPLRAQLSAQLRVPPMGARASFRVMHREVVLLRGKYTLEYVELSSSRSPIPITGLLAIPITSSAAKPAVISMDANYGMAAPFGLQGKEPINYLNAYADELASNGVVVFAPWMPTDFPNVAPEVLRAMNPDGPTSFTFTLGIYAAAVDFVSSLPAVDPARIAAWGISYSAYNALFLAALDRRVSTLVFSNAVVTADVFFRSPDAGALATWFGEICGMIDPAMQFLVAPRRLVRENGLHDDNGYERTPLESITSLRSIYGLLGIPSQFDFFRHTGGHETFARLAF